MDGLLKRGHGMETSLTLTGEVSKRDFVLGFKVDSLWEILMLPDYFSIVRRSEEK
jgi:hypothetical protein